MNCPTCGSADVEATCIGFLIVDGHRHDPNRYTCLSCGRVFGVPCPVAGCPFEGWELIGEMTLRGFSEQR